MRWEPWKVDVKGSKVTTNTCKSLSLVSNGICVTKSEDLCTFLPADVSMGDVYVVCGGV